VKDVARADDEADPLRWSGVWGDVRLHRSRPERSRIRRALQGLVAPALVASCMRMRFRHAWRTTTRRRNQEDPDRAVTLWARGNEVIRYF